VASTKTYTTSLAALGQLAAHLGKSRAFEDALHDVPAQVSAVLETADEIGQISERYRFMEDCMVVARGINQCTAQEAALKLAETNYLVTHAYSGADFQHGPIAVVAPGFPCILFNPEGKAHDLILELAAKLKERGAERVIVAHDEKSLAATEYALRIPTPVAEVTSPLVYIVAGQLFSYCLAKHKGYDPDKPRGLNKVTLTR
jgi:glucosamine--fructose-6-phosphate aminotransferase (isomerizing)